MTVEAVEARDIFGQIKEVKPFIDTLIRSRYGRIVGLVGLSVLLGVFIFVSILGGILAGIAALLAILSALIYVIYPYVKIETINPASRGIPLLLGKRVEDYTLHEGAIIVVKNVPFIGSVFEYVPIHIGTVDIDFTEVVIFDKDNFDLSVSGAFSMEADPDPKKLNEFFKRGGAHGIDDKGETIREKEGIHGIVDLLLGIVKSTLLKETGALPYPEIIRSRADLENEALKKMTMDPNAKVSALNPNRPYYITGMGANILTFVISGIEPGPDLKKIITQKGKELAEREYREIDAGTARILYQAVMGITDEELEKVDRKVMEDFYHLTKIIDQTEQEGSNIKLGEELLKLRGARFLDNINLESIGDVLRLFSKLKGSK